MTFTFVRFTAKIIITLTIAFGLVRSSTGIAAGSSQGMVFIMTNHALANSVLVFRRNADGSLQRMQEIATKGLGNGLSNDAFMSQGSLTLSSDGSLLFAINAASGDITAFVVTASGLQFGSKVSSGGSLPVSVTVYGQWVYVLNQLGTPNIMGFIVDSSGHLTPIAGSMRSLPGGALALPAQVSFTPDGTDLLVTEKGTDQIDIFPVQADGTTSSPTVQPSSGKTPFGFTFGPSGTLIVTEAERRFAKQASTSSYRLLGGALASASVAIPNGQTAACWTVVTGNTAWVVNTFTNTISSYRVGTDSTLTLLDAVAANTGDDTSPIDVAATSDGSFLYVIKSGVGQLIAYQVSGTKLTSIFRIRDLPLSMQGIAAR